MSASAGPAVVDCHEDGCQPGTAGDQLNFSIKVTPILTAKIFVAPSTLLIFIINIEIFICVLVNKTVFYI